MASQNDSGIPFGFSYNQQTVRLLELPPALLAALESPNPPTLMIKSAPAAPSAPAPPHAVLCTAHETFQLRQVHSSNSIFLARPSQSSDTAEGALLSPGLCAIASPKVTLELHPVAASSVPHLERLIPTFHGPESGDGDVEMMESSQVGSEKRGKDDILSNIPACEEECERGWIELVAFELNGGCVRPSIQALLSAYKAIFSAATSQGIRLESQFLIEDLWQAMDDDGYPRAFIEALLARLATKDHTIKGEWASVDKSKCIAWLGTLILEARQETEREWLVSDFLKEWKDNLPEAWRASASLGSIEGYYIQPNSNTIQFNRGGVDKTSAGTNVNRMSSSARKWHEKFRNSQR